MVADEEQRLAVASRLSEASAKVFPASESFGSPQMTFYFSRLLDQLIENARTLGIAAVGGDYGALYRFCYERFPKYQADAREKNEPVSTEWLDEHKSIPVMLSLWKKQLGPKPRSASVQGSSVTFRFVRGSKTKDWRLYAEVSRIPLADTALPAVAAIKSLPDAVRLPAKGDLELRAADLHRRSKAIIERRVKDLRDRDMAEAYRQRLAAMSYDKLVAHDDEVRAQKKAKDYTRTLIAIALVLAAFVTYRVYRSRTVSIELRTHAGHVHVENIKVNAEGRIAQFSTSGERLTPWAHVLQNSDTGLTIRAVGKDARGNWQLRLTGGGSVNMSADIPDTWRTSSPVLQPALQWTTYPGETRKILLYVYVDRRAFPRGVTLPGSDTLPAKITVRDRQGTELGSAMANTLSLLSLDSKQNKWLIYAQVEFLRTGENIVQLEWVRDALSVRQLPAGGFAYDKPRLTWIDLLRLNISDRDEPKTVPAPPPQTFVPATVRTIRFGCGLPVQAYISPQPSDSTAVNLSIVPDARAWPTLNELAQAVYGITDETTGIWYTQDRLQAYPLHEKCDPQGYALTMTRTLTPGDHTLLLEGLRSGKRLPSRRFTIPVRAGAPPAFVNDKNITALLPAEGGLPIAVLDARYKTDCHCFSEH
jgi:hypothetical protein